MAERPIFLPALESPGLVREVSLSFEWHSGFAHVQKQKNVKALHAAAATAGYAPVLEVSTKSEDKLGRHLSAFHLKVHSERLGDIPLESAYQGSKIFEHGGPNTDLYAVDPKTAKQDPRIQTSGRIVAFSFDGFDFPTEPKTVFYDWLYINAILEHREWLLSRLSRYAAFSDIEFNPHRSINCQARSCALFTALLSTDALASAVESPSVFIELAGSLAHDTPVHDVQEREPF